MKIVSPRGCRALLLAILFGLGCPPALPAEPLPYIGRWLPDAHPPASRALLTIKKASLSLRGPDTSAPSCTREFVLKNEKAGTVYRDGRGTKFVAGAKGSLPTYLLTLGAGTCDSLTNEMRISFPMVYDINHIEVIEYANGKPVSSQRFHRKK
jgi:hypothetical protein